MWSPSYARAQIVQILQKNNPAPYTGYLLDKDAMQKLEANSEIGGLNKSRLNELENNCLPVIEQFKDVSSNEKLGWFLFGGGTVAIIAIFLQGLIHH